MTWFDPKNELGQTAPEADETSVLVKEPWRNPYDIALTALWVTGLAVALLLLIIGALAFGGGYQED